MAPQTDGTGSLDEFLNPKSMLTPGVAGSLVMLITNAICFNFTELPHRWVGLALSGIIGFFIVSKGKIPLFQKMAFCVFNSLIIFSVGMGTANFVGQPTPPPPSAKSASASSETSNAYLFDLFCSTANAQELPLQSTNLINKESDLSLGTVSNAHIKALSIGEIVSATNSLLSGAARPITNSWLQIRMDNEEIARLKTTNELLVSHINALETESSNSAAKRPRKFFQTW